MGAARFAQMWEGSREPTIVDKIRGFLSHDNEPMAKKAIMANYRIKAALGRIRAYIDKLNARDRELFSRAVEALMRRDEYRAKMYVNEVAEIRSIAKQLLTVEYVLEQASLRLETFLIVGGAIKEVLPVIDIVKEASGLLKGLAPDAWIELTLAMNDLNSVMTSTGFGVAGEHSITLSSAEAKRIFEEAKVVAEQQMKEKFPELPSLLMSKKKKLEEEESIDAGAD